MARYLFPILTIILLYSCQDSSKQKALEQRELQLQEKERQLKAREAEYQALVQMRDSLQKLDSIAKPEFWPSFVNGQWTSKIVCTESSCSDYVIGDTRSDLWEFVRDSARMQVNIRDRNKLVRIYTGQFTQDQIHLAFTSDSTAPKRVEMKVNITEISKERLRGTRVVNIGDCQAKFNVTLTRQENLK